jgi:hypothetical protein
MVIHRKATFYHWKKWLFLCGTRKEFTCPAMQQCDAVVYVIVKTILSTRLELIGMRKFEVSEGNLLMVLLKRDRLFILAEYRKTLTSSSGV